MAAQGSDWRHATHHLESSSDQHLCVDLDPDGLVPNMTIDAHLIHMLGDPGEITDLVFTTRVALTIVPHVSSLCGAGCHYYAMIKSEWHPAVSAHIYTDSSEASGRSSWAAVLIVELQKSYALAGHTGGVVCLDPASEQFVGAASHSAFAAEL